MLARSGLDSQCVNIQLGIRERCFAALVGFTLAAVWRKLTIPSLVVFSLSGVSLIISKTRTQIPDIDQILPITESEASLLYRLAPNYFISCF